MEGPSLALAEEQLAPFRGRRIVAASGSSKQVDVPAFEGLVLRDIFSWGKHLVFQFDSFAVRIHFMRYGTFEAKEYDNRTSIMDDGEACPLELLVRGRAEKEGLLMEPLVG